MTLKSATRRTAALTVAAGCAVALTACGAGQISQTANQVAAVDGSDGQSEDGVITLRDVIVHPTTDGEQGAVKFTASSQETTGVDHVLESVTVDGKPVKIMGETTVAPNCSLVGDSADRIEEMGAKLGTSGSTMSSSSASASTAMSDKNMVPVPQARSTTGAPCSTYVVTSLAEKPVSGTTKKVSFKFDTGTIEVVAPVALPTPPAGEVYRQNDGIEETGAPEKAAGAAHEHSEHAK